MKTAVLVTAMSHVGGTEVATAIQARALANAGWRVSVLGETGPLSAALAQDGVGQEPIRLYSRNPFVLMRSVLRITSVFYRQRADVVHCQMARPVPLVWVALLLSGNSRRTKLFWTSRGMEAKSYARVVPLFNRLGIRALGNCRREAEKLLRYGMDPNRTSYVYNAYRMSAADRRSSRPDAPPLVIGTLAALRPDRRLDHFIRMAHKFLEQAGPASRVEFRVAGDGPARGALETLARELGIADRVHFSGSVSDVTGFLSQLHVMVSTAHSDQPDWGAGLSNAIIESMVVAVPVVAYDAAGIAEIVIDGKTGYLAPPGDLDALTDAVTAAVSDPVEAEIRADAAYRNILAECDPDSVLRRLLDLYRDL